jgi:hypothetical protein
MSEEQALNSPIELNDNDLDCVVGGESGGVAKFSSETRQGKHPSVLVATGGIDPRQGGKVITGAFLFLTFLPGPLGRVSRGTLRVARISREDLASEVFSP